MTLLSEVQHANPKLALENFEKAIAIDPGYGDALQQAGYLAGSNFSEFDRALGCFMRCKTIMDRLNLRNTLNYGNLLINIGFVYQKRNSLDESLEYFNHDEPGGLQGHRFYPLGALRKRRCCIRGSCMATVPRRKSWKPESHFTTGG